jgi:hypothetical protein
LFLNLLFVFVACSQVLQGALQYPYRSENLTNNTSTVVVGGNSHLLVAKDRAEDIEAVTRISQKIDVDVSNRPYLVDLSPFTTFVAYEIGFKSVETPFFLNTDYLLELAERNDVTLQQAWIMTSDSNQSIDPSQLLIGLGKTLEKDYKLYAILEGDYCRNTQCTLFLWKPI